MAENLSFLWAGKKAEKGWDWGLSGAGHGGRWRSGIAAEEPERDSCLRTCIRHQSRVSPQLRPDTRNL